MPRRRHRTWHSTPSQYTDTGSTCCCAIHWCGTSHWNTQLPILMSWVRPAWEILPWPSTHTSERSTLWCCYGGSSVESTIPTGTWTFYKFYFSWFSSGKTISTNICEITRYSLAWYNEISHFFLNMLMWICSSWLKCEMSCLYALCSKNYIQIVLLK